MLHRQWQSLLREIEHVKEDGLRTSVFAVVNVTDHLDDGLTFVHYFFLAVQTDDG